MLNFDQRNQRVQGFALKDRARAGLLDFTWDIHEVLSSCQHDPIYCKQAVDLYNHSLDLIKQAFDCFSYEYYTYIDTRIMSILNNPALTETQKLYEIYLFTLSIIYDMSSKRPVVFR